VSPGSVYFHRFRIHSGLFLLVFFVAGDVVGAGAVRARILCLGQHAYSDGRDHTDYDCNAADLLVVVSYDVGYGAGDCIRYWDHRQRRRDCAATAHTWNGSARRDELERAWQSRLDWRCLGWIELRSHAYCYARWQPPRRLAQSGIRKRDMGRSSGG